GCPSLVSVHVLLAGVLPRRRWRPAALLGLLLRESPSHRPAPLPARRHPPVLRRPAAQRGRRVVGPGQRPRPDDRGGPGLPLLRPGVLALLAPLPGRRPRNPPPA